MAKLTHILKKDELEMLENCKSQLVKNDYKIAGKLYSTLKTHCILNNIQMKLDPKGRIKKVLISVDNQKVMAKPIIQNNKLVFFYKKNYYNSLDSINRQIEYTAVK